MATRKKKATKKRRPKREWLELLKRFGPCGSGLAFVSGFRTLREAWKACTRHDWLVWLLDEVYSSDMPNAVTEDDVLQHVRQSLENHMASDDLWLPDATFTVEAIRDYYDCPSLDDLRKAVKRLDERLGLDDGEDRLTD